MVVRNTIYSNIPEKLRLVGRGFLVVTIVLPIFVTIVISIFTTVVVFVIIVVTIVILVTIVTRICCRMWVRMG